MIIYIYRGEYGNKKKELLMKAARMYVEQSPCFAEVDFNCLALEKTRNGKPYFSGLPFHFSLSHTGGIWGCLISTSNSGLDIQKIKKIDFSKLAGRFFLEEEKKFVETNGAEGFFEIWVRKEACMKYYGTGIFSGLKSFPVVTDGRLADKVDFMGNICFVSSFDLDDSVKCAYCSAEVGTGPWIRELK